VATDISEAPLEEVALAAPENEVPADDESSGVEAEGVPEPAEPEPTLAAELGLSDEYASLSDRDLAKSLHGTISTQHESMQRDRQLLQQERQLWQQSEDYRGYQDWQKQQKQQSETKEETKFWDPPEFNQGLLERYTTTDPETGNRKWTDEAPLDLRRQADEYTTYVAAFEQKFRSDPYATIDPYLTHREDQHLQRVEKLIDQRMGQSSDQTYFDAFERDNSGWLYQRDMAGNPMKQSDGTPAWSPEAMEVLSIADQLERSGMQDKKQRLQQSLDIYELRLRRGLSDGNGAATENDTKKTNFLKNSAKKSAARGGSDPKPESRKRSQDEKISFAERMKRSFDKQGITDDDLDNSF
jgi:hypothetical protein